MHEVAVIRAGPAGLGVPGLHFIGFSKPISGNLRQIALDARWIAKALRANTERALSGLPGMPIPRKHGKWVPRAGVVEYLEEYARRHQLRLRLSTPVDQIERESAAWRL